MRPLMLIAMFAGTLACQGCIVHLNRDRSIGQELIELQQARAAGTITEDEFRARRAEACSQAGAPILPTSSMP